MKFIHVKDYDELSFKAAQIMLDECKENNKTNICLASGDSPKKTYELFTKEVLAQQIDTRFMTITKLDEWVGIERDSELSCEKYIRTMVVDPLHLQDRFISFLPDGNPEEEVNKVNAELSKKPIDLCVLGFGRNGHLGLNEPASHLFAHAHQIQISEVTKHHPMIKANHSIEYGMTIGMKDILDSKKVLLLMSGEGKKKLYQEFLTENISTQLPASFLWLHSNTIVIVRDDQF